MRSELEKELYGSELKKELRSELRSELRNELCGVYGSEFANFMNSESEFRNFR